MVFSKGRILFLAAIVTIGLLTTVVYAKTICNYCKGTGKILEVTKQCPLHNPLFCTHCDGSGLIGPPCPYCGGLGYILTPAEKEAEKKARAKADAEAREKQKVLEAKKAQEDSLARIELAKAEDDKKARGITNKRKQSHIGRTIAQNDDAIRNAYNNRLRKIGREGKITIKFVINERGKVVSIQMMESTMNDSDLESAVIVNVRNIDFKKIDELSDMTESTYTFTFSPAY